MDRKTLLESKSGMSATQTIIDEVTKQIPNRAERRKNGERGQLFISTAKEAHDTFATHAKRLYKRKRGAK